MFTGLIEATSKVVCLKHFEHRDLAQLTLEKPAHFSDVEQGHSIACNGVCLTVTNSNPTTTLKFDLGAETLDLTTLGGLQPGQTLNLERALKLGDRLHGHMVTGHVDEVAKLGKRTPLEGGCLKLTIEGLSHPEFIMKKGSIVINGVSLTLNEVSSKGFEVCLIPETLEKTNLGGLSVGGSINIEYDFLLKGVIHANTFLSK